VSTGPPRVLGILGSTRRGRVGDRVAAWFAELAGARDDLAYAPVDLRDWSFPLLDAAIPPARRRYEDELTIRWGQTVASADGFVLITPEYNHGYPAVLKNALDLIYHEWGRKPVAFVSYGGPGGGVRAVQQLREVAIELDLVPLRRQVAIPRVHSALGEEGRPNDPWYAASAARLLDDLAWWAQALAAARAGS